MFFELISANVKYFYFRMSQFITKKIKIELQWSGLLGSEYLVWKVFEKCSRLNEVEKGNNIW